MEHPYKYLNRSVALQLICLHSSCISLCSDLLTSPHVIYPFGPLFCGGQSLQTIYSAVVDEVNNSFFLIFKLGGICGTDGKQIMFFF